MIAGIALAWIFPPDLPEFRTGLNIVGLVYVSLWARRFSPASELQRARS
jgi:hypothetical protein